MVLTLEALRWDGSTTKKAPAEADALSSPCSGAISEHMFASVSASAAAARALGYRGLAELIEQENIPARAWLVVESRTSAKETRGPPKLKILTPRVPQPIEPAASSGLDARLISFRQWISLGAVPEESGSPVVSFAL